MIDGEAMGELENFKRLLCEANHRCGAAWRDLADARKRIADLDAHVLMQRETIAEQRREIDSMAVMAVAP